MRPLFQSLAVFLVYTLSAALAARYDVDWFCPDLLAIAVVHAARLYGPFGAYAMAWVFAILFANFHYAPPIVFVIEAVAIVAFIRLSGRRLNLANPLFVGATLGVMSGLAQLMIGALVDKLRVEPFLVGPTISHEQAWMVALSTAIVGPFLLAIWQRLEERLLRESHRELFILR